MARVVFASAAFLGDVAPFVEPANRLATRGHDVEFVLPAGFHGLLRGERFSLTKYPLDFSPAGMGADAVYRGLVRHPWRNQLRLGRYWMRRGFVDDPAAAREALLDSLRDADVLVTHPTFGSATIPVAQHLGVPVVVGQLFPMMMPTDTHGPPVGPINLDLKARTLNRWAWHGFAKGSGLALYDRAMNGHRATLGQPPISGNALLAWAGAERTVVLVSRHYFGDEPADWVNSRLAGFSSWTGPSGLEVEPRVDRFLEAGPPPVLVCLGTSAAAGAGRAFAKIADDLAAGGLRPLLLVGNADNLGHVGHVPGAFEFAPVPAVAPRCRAVVVSGALGTLAAALTAGVPVVVLPQLFDQIWHGRRVEQLGVGVMVTRPSRVASAVADVLSDPAYAERARALGTKLRLEDGAAALVDAVEATIAH